MTLMMSIKITNSNDNFADNSLPFNRNGWGGIEYNSNIGKNAGLCNAK
jgi:hypothetical protein